MFNANISLVEALEITAISMIIVFLILALIAFILSLFKYIPKDETKKDAKVEKKFQQIDNETKMREKFDESKITSEDMRVAMMVACIEASSQDDGNTIKVIGIKELN